MKTKVVGAIAVMCVAVAVALAVISSKNGRTVGILPAGHGIKCLKADGTTPCGNPEVDNLNGLISGVQKAVATAQAAKDKAQGVVSQVQQAGQQAKQMAQDAKQTAKDTKQVAQDAKNKDVKKAVQDGQQAGNDAGQAAGDTQGAAGATQQAAKDLQGVASLSLKSPNGELNCVQTTGLACSDDQTRAVQIHAAQLQPQLKVQREVDQASN